MVKLLVKAKANVNAADNNGQTALIWAASYGHTDSILALVDAKREWLCGRVHVHGHINTEGGERGRAVYVNGAQWIGFTHSPPTLTHSLTH